MCKILEHMLGEMTPQTIVVVILVTLVTLVVLYRMLFGGSSKRLDLILLVGPCGSGKTSLFYLWKNGKVPDTVTSQVPNRGFVVKGVKEEVVDCPGHARLRNSVFELVPRAKKIVFLVDESCVKEAADSLFQIFVLPRLNTKTEMMICVNKVDKKGADEVSVVEALNKEIRLLQKTKTEDGEYVGVEGEEFDITLHAPIKVVTGKASVKKGDVKEVEQFLQ